MRHRYSEPQWLLVGTESAPQKTRAEIETRNPARERGWNLCLGDCRRRVLEYARSYERRSDPNRMLRRNKTEMENRSRRYDQRRGRWLVIITRANQGDGAFVLGSIGV
jgi:hypothetical protein